MARFSFGIWDSITSTYLSGESVQIKDGAGGTVLASTIDIGVGILVSPNGDGTYYANDIPAQNLWVYVGGAMQQELSNIPWDNGTSATHTALTTAHGSTGDVLGQGDVDGATIVYSGDLKVKDAGIGATQLASDAVTEIKILDNVVSSSKLKLGSVTTPKIEDLNVTGAKLATAVAGKGIKKDASSNLEVEVSADSGEVDLEFNASNALKLVKSFPGARYIVESKTLSENLTIIDNTLSQAASQSSPDGGSFYQVLYVSTSEDLAPSGALSSPFFQMSAATYQTGLYQTIIKIPEMLQLVMYFRAKSDNAGETGYLKLLAGSLSGESTAINTTSYINYAVYLDIASLPNWEPFNIQMQMKISGGATLTASAVEIVARAEVTALSGETSYNNERPVE